MVLLYSPERGQSIGVVKQCPVRLGNGEVWYCFVARRNGEVMRHDSLRWQCKVSQVTVASGGKMDKNRLGLLVTLAIANGVLVAIALIKIFR